VDRTRAVLLAVGLLAIGLPAGVLGPVGPAAAATGNVDVDDYGYAPGQVRVEEGDRVTWTNEGSQVHTVTSDNPAAEDFDSGRLGSGDEYSHTFSEPGTYSYHCEIHGSMKAEVQVGSPPPTASSSTTTSSTTTTSPTTTTTGAPETTTTTRPPPTATTVPASPTTTATTGRPPAAAGSPAPTPSSAPTTTTQPPATSTTTTPESTTTTAAGETPTTSAPAATASDTPLGPEVPERRPPQEEDGEGDLAGEGASSPLSRRSDGGANAGIILLVFALVGAGAFGGWTLWKLRPGHD
jgi:plastocyanin